MEDTDRMVSRVGDMHYSRRLVITQQKDGDVVVSIFQDGSQIGGYDIGNPEQSCAEVEFCVSGGRSRKVHAAVVALAHVIREENLENPIVIDEE